MRASNEMPTFDALFEPLLAALRALGDSGSIEEIYAKTVEVAGISEDVASQMHDPDKSNMTEVGYRLAWARTYLRKYGLIDNEGGILHDLAQHLHLQRRTVDGGLPVPGPARPVVGNPSQPY